MAQIIEIDGGLVNVIERSINFSVPLSDWLEKIERRLPIYTPVLPSNTRAIWWNPTNLTEQKLLILIELQPRIINMNFNGDMYDLAIPFTRFIFCARTANPDDPSMWRLEDYRIMWSNHRYNNPAAIDMLPAMLPNVYEEGRICFGSTGANADQNLADRLDQTVNEFYATEFNRDLTIRYPHTHRSHSAWATATLRNPNCWINWNDWTNIATARYATSWERLCDQFLNDPHPRNAPVLSNDPIPPLELGATFGRTSEWLATLNNNQRARLLEATLQHHALNNEAYRPTPSAEDET